MRYSKQDSNCKKEAKKIPFNIPPRTQNELEYIKKAIDSGHISGDGLFTRKCSEWLERQTQAQKVLLTTSGTSALDMALLLCDLKPGDEVILPSYTFPSTANAAVLVGARLVFVDIRPDTMNVDEMKIEAAISDRTKAIIVMHYAGVSCEMDTIMKIAECYGLKVVEDAAQGVMSTYKGKALGTIGDYGCYSFHETKNYSMGEGGALSIRDMVNNEKAEVLREKGTNRSKFYRGEIDKYTWVDFGDSYLPSELNAAYLWGQLEIAQMINEKRKSLWNRYYGAFLPWELKERIEIPKVPIECIHNAHLFYIKLNNADERTRFISFLKQKGIHSVFHYIPLHSSAAGKKYGVFRGEDIYTTKESERLVRLPLYYELSEDKQNRVIQAVEDFLKERI